MKLKPLYRFDLEGVRNWTLEQWLSLFNEIPETVTQHPDGEKLEIVMMSGFWTYVVSIKDFDFAVKFRIYMKPFGGKLYEITVYGDRTHYVTSGINVMVCREFVELHSEVDGNEAVHPRSCRVALRAMRRHGLPVLLVYEGEIPRLVTDHVLLTDDFVRGSQYDDPAKELEEEYKLRGIPYVILGGRLSVII